MVASHEHADILALFAEGLSPSEIDRRMGLPPNTARCAIIGAWKSNAEIRPRKAKGSTRRLLDHDTVRAIRADQEKGLTIKVVAERHGVSPSAVSRIWHGETYREVV